MDWKDATDLAAILADTLTVRAGTMSDEDAERLRQEIKKFRVVANVAHTHCVYTSQPMTVEPHWDQRRLRTLKRALNGVLR
jgi:hypothetical protein